MSVTAAPDVAEIPDPEVEAYASVGASIRQWNMQGFLQLMVVISVGPSTSLGLGQTTHMTPGTSVGLATAPVASGVTPESHQQVRHNTSRYGTSFLIDGGPFISAAFC